MISKHETQKQHLWVEQPKISVLEDKKATAADEVATVRDG